MVMNPMMARRPLEMPMMEGVEAGEAPGNDNEGAIDAKALNVRIQKVIDEIKDIAADARSAGVYNDRASLSALQALVSDASAIKDQWMQSDEVGGEKEYEHEPAKLVEVVKGGPDEGPNRFNRFGGQTINVK